LHTKKFYYRPYIKLLKKEDKEKLEKNYAVQKKALQLCDSDLLAQRAILMGKHLKQCCISKSDVDDDASAALDEYGPQCMAATKVTENMLDVVLQKDLADCVATWEAKSETTDQLIAAATKKRKTSCLRARHFMMKLVQDYLNAAKHLYSTVKPDEITPFANAYLTMCDHTHTPEACFSKYLKMTIKLHNAAMHAGHN
jgi:hypothetical protein